METYSRFQDANERIAARAKELSFEGRVPFLCECDDERCTHVVALGLDEYEGVRSREGRVVTLPGHPVGEGAEVVEEGDRFTLVDNPRPAS